MRRYLTTVIFAVAVIGLYHFVDIRLFNLDLARSARTKEFDLRRTPSTDPTVVLFNVGKLELSEVQGKIDSLLIANPRKVGINLCHWDKVPNQIIERYKGDGRVVFANCSGSGSGSLSQIIGEQNTVTHFKTDRPDYFEQQLTNFKGRGNEVERINYGPRLAASGLTSRFFWFDKDFLRAKTVLLGYMGDYSTDSIYYYLNTRITPLNHYYGEDEVLPDMYDIEISAHIMRTINEKDFIDEVNQVVRVLIILSISLLSVAILTFTKTRWTIVNLTIATLLFILLTGAGSFLVVLMFDKRYYLEMDELPLILLIITVFTVIINIRKKKKGSNTERAKVSIRS
jgi:hypothetical protein